MFSVIEFKEMRGTAVVIIINIVSPSFLSIGFVSMVDSIAPKIINQELESIWIGLARAISSTYKTKW